MPTCPCIQAGLLPLISIKICVKIRLFYRCATKCRDTFHFLALLLYYNANIFAFSTQKFLHYDIFFAVFCLFCLFYSFMPYFFSLCCRVCLFIFRTSAVLEMFPPSEIITSRIISSSRFAKYSSNGPCRSHLSASCPIA